MQQIETDLDVRPLLYCNARYFAYNVVQLRGSSQDASVPSSKDIPGPGRMWDGLAALQVSGSQSQLFGICLLRYFREFTSFGATLLPLENALENMSTQFLFRQPDSVHGAH